MEKLIAKKDNKKLICPKCNRTFNFRAALDYHLYKKKNPCKSLKQIGQNINKTIAPECTSIKCEFCKKDFTRQFCLKRHLLNCPIKTKKESGNEKILTKLVAEIESIKTKNNELANKNSELEDKICYLTEKLKKKEIIQSNSNNSNSIVNSNVMNSNTVNNNNFNIKLMAVGKEQMDHLTESDYKFIINKGFKSIPEMVKKVNFNEKAPENHNIFISDISGPYINVYDGTNWELKSKKETIDDLYDNNRDILDDKFTELEEKLPEHAIKKFKRFLNDEKDSKVSNKVKDDLKLVLYNNKYLPMETKKRLTIGGPVV